MWVQPTHRVCPGDRQPQVALRPVASGDQILKFLAEQSAKTAAGAAASVVPLRGAFVFREHQCLAFPKLAYNLYELLKHQNFEGLSLKLVAGTPRRLLLLLGFEVAPFGSYAVGCVLVGCCTVCCLLMQQCLSLVI